MPGKLLTTVATLILAAMLGWTGTAMAHSALVDSDPADGAQLDIGPKQIRLTFNEPVKPDYTTMTVVGPDGASFADGPAQAHGSNVTVAVKNLGPAGLYTVAYRVVSEDGHPVNGKTTFTLTRAATSPSTATPAPPTTSAAPTTREPQTPPAEGGADIRPWVAAGVILLLIGLALAFLLGRSSRR